MQSFKTAANIIFQIYGIYGLINFTVTAAVYRNFTEVILLWPGIRIFSYGFPLMREKKIKALLTHSPTALEWALFQFDFVTTHHNMFGFIWAVKPLTTLTIEISVAMQLEQNEVNKAIDKLLLFQALQTQSRDVSTRQIAVTFSIFYWQL